MDLKKFRKIAAGDRLRGQYQALSQDPNSLSNLDQVYVGLRNSAFCFIFLNMYGIIVSQYIFYSSEEYLAFFPPLFLLFFFCFSINVNLTYLS